MRNRLSISRWCAVVGLLLLVALLAPPGLAGGNEPRDAASIKGEMQRLIDHVDGPGYAQAVSWDEHIVVSYRLGQGRDPTVVEFTLLRALHENLDLERSSAVSMALRGTEPRTTWDQCRELLARATPDAWHVDDSVRQAVERLAAVPLWQVSQALKERQAGAAGQPPEAAPEGEPPVPGIRYHTYFGQLHAHTELSDGTGTPMEAYTYARDVAGLDFFAVTDHGEMLDFWPWQHEWEDVLEAAEATNQPGSYAALWGFEWSNPLLGHINVIGTADNTGAVSNTALDEIYDWIAERPAAVALFNHPGDFDLTGEEFAHLELYAPAVPQLVGIENWNGNSNFDHYYYNGSWESSYGYWDAGNQQGWYLGSEGAQDNHDADWGTMNTYRTAVLAPSLTRENILAAYRARRFYATEDANLEIDLSCGGYPMGSRLTGAPRLFSVSACDLSGDAIQHIRLYRNGDLLATRPVSGTCARARFSDLGTTEPAYYYVIVRLAVDHDGNGRNDEAISSPIWIQ